MRYGDTICHSAGMTGDPFAAWSKAPPDKLLFMFEVAAAVAAIPSFRTSVIERRACLMAKILVLI
jgi:hypothetical protein